MSDKQFTKRLIVASIIYGVVVSAAVNFSIAGLQGATIKQCREHDWPVDQHKQHINWCIDNGYDVNTN